jgi:hypothetical protein
MKSLLDSLTSYGIAVNYYLGGPGEATTFKILKNASMSCIIPFF